MKIHDLEFDALDRGDIEEIDADHPAVAVARVHRRGGDLRPAARRRAKVDDLLAAPEQVIFVGDFNQLVGRAGAKPLAPRLRDKRIVQLTGQPQSRGQAAFSIGAHLGLERPAPLVPRTAAAFRHG